MCRMLLINGKTNISPFIDALQQMARDNTLKHEGNHGKFGTCQHPHGWGIAYLQDNTWRVHKSPVACFADPTIETFRNIQADAVILHARQATHGVQRLENTHPFLKDNTLFFHNGEIFDNLPSSVTGMQGETDSERFFHAIHALEGKSITKEGLSVALQALQDFSAANCFIATPENMFVTVHHGKRAKPRYHSMYRAQTSEAVIYSVEQLPFISQWEKIQTNTIVQIPLQKKLITAQH